MSRTLTINKRSIGAGHPVYVVAEISANHNQDYERAVRIVQAAKDAGADAVKLQTYTADTITIDSDRPEFMVRGGTLWDGRTLHHLYREAFTPWEWYPRLLGQAEALGLDLFSTPFDHTAVDFLAAHGSPAYKIASFEVVDIPLIRHAARQGRPLIMSVGMASEEEIQAAVGATREVGNPHLALLKCTSAYPAPPDEMNLRTLVDMAERFAVPVGLSDHTMGSATAVAAVALGACIVEKHLTLSRADGGPDAAFSCEPQELAELVRDIRTVEAALGSVHYGPAAHERANLRFRRSLFAVEFIKAGEVFTNENIRSIRPADGLPPILLDQVLGRTAAADIPRGTPLREDLLGDKPKRDQTDGQQAQKG